MKLTLAMHDAPTSGASATTRLARVALQSFRIAVLLAIAWIIRQHHVRLRIEGHAPITVTETRQIFPEADEVRPDATERAGMFVHDASGAQLG